MRVIWMPPQGNRCLNRASVRHERRRSLYLLPSIESQFASPPTRPTGLGTASGHAWAADATACARRRDEAIAARPECGLAGVELAAETPWTAGEQQGDWINKKIDVVSDTPLCFELRLAARGLVRIGKSRCVRRFRSMTLALIDSLKDCRATGIRRRTVTYHELTRSVRVATRGGSI